MPSRKFHTIADAKTQPSPANQPPTSISPDQAGAQTLQADRLEHAAAGPRGLPPLEAGAAALNQATAARLARAGQSLLQLQRRYGNRYVQQVVAQARLPGSPAAGSAASIIQPKLALGPAGDSYEREADRVAAGLNGRIHALAGQAVALRRRPSAADAAVDPAVEAGIRRARGGGQPLPQRLRATMEQALGSDFGAVRVHADAQADTLNQSLQARAFTTGQDIFFRRGEYSPTSAEGQSLLAHELTHVVQQSGISSRESGSQTVGQLATATGRGGGWFIQRDQGNAADLREGKYATVGRGGSITYGALAAGCMAVTAGFTAGGGTGYHFAMLMDNATQWAEFIGQVGANAVNSLYVDTEFIGQAQGWYVLYTPGANPVPDTTVGPTAYAELRDNFGGDDDLMAQAGWKNDEDSVAAWFYAAVGRYPRIRYTQNAGTYRF